MPSIHEHTAGPQTLGSSDGWLRNTTSRPLAPSMRGPRGLRLAVAVYSLNIVTGMIPEAIAQTSAVGRMELHADSDWNFVVGDVWKKMAGRYRWKARSERSAQAGLSAKLPLSAKDSRT